MIRITECYIDGGRIGEGCRKRVIDSEQPVFRWAVESDHPNDRQTACRVTVRDERRCLWDSGVVESAEQSLTYGGEPLPHGLYLEVSLSCAGADGVWSEPFCTSLLDGNLTEEERQGEWIGASAENEGRALYFRKSFRVSGEVKSACLYCAGLGYHRISLNGCEPDDALLDPAHSNYARLTYYVVHANAADFLEEGENVLGVEVADGWRNNLTNVLRNALGSRKIEYFGAPMLWAMLTIRYADGTVQTVVTDESWEWKFGAITRASIFGGETYDASRADEDWNGKNPHGFSPVVRTEGPGGVLRPMALEPILVQKEYPALEITQPKKGSFVVDFGQNLAGVCRLVLPENLRAGQTIAIRHAEELSEDGTLFTEPLRGAECTDRYVASGDGRDLLIWQPSFTYHGFRYAEVTGVESLSKADITAVMFCTDLKNGSFFRCGSPIVNKIQEAIVMTEMDNMHSILTDCPQRDERMGWMNDATVRFEETPYNFDIGRIFPKVIRDIRAEQREHGEFTCCCPFCFGGLPADPVCSSYLVAGLESLLHRGNRALIEESFDGFAAWEDFLLTRSDSYIVNYSYYGDWAAPAYAVIGEDGAVNSETEGILMSTGYSYFNAKTLAYFAKVIGRAAEEARYTELAGKIRDAFLEKWWNPETAVVAKGSQAAQAFALWLGLIPEGYEQRAAQVMRDDLVSRNYRFTTGNLCTRYLLDMLTKYGYLEDAWRLLTSETYPSYGWMLQNEATTIWERFELKKNPGMNSHNHPMYGAAGYFFYAYIAGIVPTEPAYDRVRIQPYFPETLQSAQAVVDTVKGDICVRWSKRYDKTRLFVQIPFGVTADVVFDGKTETVGSGYHVFEA